MLMEGLPGDLNEKYTRLLNRLGEFDSMLVAFSGGVDSGLLAAAAHQALGERMLAVTIHSPVETDDVVAAAEATARAAGFRHRVVEFNDLENPRFVENPPDRCYHCKLNRLTALREMGAEEGYSALAEGSNAEDAGDYRPGKRAVEQLGILSPLAEVGLVKSEIRLLARALSLPIWDRPSAPCLATRFPYGVEVTAEGIRQVAQAEAYVHAQGFKTVRVRHHGGLARIEVASEDIPRLVELREAISIFFSTLGYTHTSVDLKGYRSGSLNEGLNLE